MERTRFGLFFFLLFLLASQMVVQSEGRHCESKSHRFKGMCVHERNCASVCNLEGFSGEKCRGFRRRCFCTRHC
ncbi:defensin Ec-AMP-D2-like [Arachis stenosperma]|uniref:defensin Ec-AMP-D2-like n=1 Tax=Arachis stenosperma TaxID=217475 RepID=UPI0025AC7483|nr:defensin Ec-AMP-D2-like [Arachis stenosperma]